MPATNMEEGGSSGSGNLLLEPYMIAAIVCFSLGGVLIIFGVARLIYFMSVSRREEQKFRYLLRYPHYLRDNRSEFGESMEELNGWF